MIVDQSIIDTCDEFFHTANITISHTLQDQVNKFVERSINSKMTTVLITSGGTTVPLERNTVRFIDNFSTGMRGATSAEFFLQQHYNVIFLYRESSKRPFRSCIELALSDSLHTATQGESSISFENLSTSVIGQLGHLSRALQNQSLMEISFTSVFEYMVLFRFLCQSFQPLGRRLMIYSAAAVSDFYVPANDMNEHKIQSSTGIPLISLTNTPKMLYMVTKVWVPQAYVVSFKLETDALILIEKATSAIKKYDVDCVVANILMTRYSEIRLIFNLHSDKNAEISNQSESDLMIELVTKDSHEPLEAQFVKRLIDVHTLSL